VALLRLTDNEPPIEPTSVVVVGHFSDPRAAECIAEARRTCEDRLVLDAVAWAGRPLRAGDDGTEMAPLPWPNVFEQTESVDPEPVSLLAKQAFGPDALLLSAENRFTRRGRPAWWIAALMPGPDGPTVRADLVDARTGQVIVGDGPQPDTDGSG
jgi:hypothetical protein